MSSKILCIHFINGYCKYGNNCKYSHAINSHAINSHAINSHAINSHVINNLQTTNNKSITPDISHKIKGYDYIATLGKITFKQYQYISKRLPKYNKNIYANYCNYNNELIIETNSELDCWSFANFNYYNKVSVNIDDKYFNILKDFSNNRNGLSIHISFLEDSGSSLMKTLSTVGKMCFYSKFTAFDWDNSNTNSNSNTNTNTNADSFTVVKKKKKKSSNISYSQYISNNYNNVTEIPVKNQDINIYFNEYSSEYHNKYCNEYIDSYATNVQVNIDDYNNRVPIEMEMEHSDDKCKYVIITSNITNCNLCDEILLNFDKYINILTAKLDKFIAKYGSLDYNTQFQKYCEMWIDDCELDDVVNNTNCNNYYENLGGNNTNINTNNTNNTNSTNNRTYADILLNQKMPIKKYNDNNNDNNNVNNVNINNVPEPVETVLITQPTKQEFVDVGIEIKPMIISGIKFPLVDIDDENFRI